MPTALPDDSVVNLDRPDAAEVALLGRGFVSAVKPAQGLTELQGVLLEAVTESMTGFTLDLDVAEIVPAEFAQGLARRNEAFRARILQVMLLAALVLRPLPEDVAERLEAFAAELGVGDGMLEVARGFARGNLGLAAFDFERNGYTAEWAPERQSALHSSKELAGAWELSVDDAPLAARWTDLEDLPAGTIGRSVTDFYRARGFDYPGRPGSAPPLLAQHDWVHVLADYGTTVESELEVFAFIARANDDMKAFSLLAMVVSLFETGYMRTGAGLFQSSPGQLSRKGMAVRVADAMRRGAEGRGSTDFLNVDWFDIADYPVDDARERFGVVPKSGRAIAAGSVGPWERGGISPYQWKAGHVAAEAEGREYDSFGALVAEQG
jgi:hypothetical protein